MKSASRQVQINNLFERVMINLSFDQLRHKKW